MSRGRLVLAIVAIFAGFSACGTSGATSNHVAPRCGPSSVRITDFNTLVGAGSVNDLFWIRNVSLEACTLRGYVRVAYIGAYGMGPTENHPHRLQVSEAHSYGRDGNDVGGLKGGLRIPTVTLQPESGIASFWIYGTDEPHSPPPTRCIVSHKMLVWLPGASSLIVVQPLRANGFFWCGGFVVHPVVPGESGSDPPMPLSYYFGTPG
ncbi:MAG: hypothetical protein WA786_10650 [Acidimicrobiales bacterium]